ncbi:MAG: DUF5685 family protein [Faecalibacterium sp.]
MKPYLPELTIRDYNTYLWYLRGVLRQMYTTYGLYSCLTMRSSGVLFALLADSLAGRPATCKPMRMPFSPFRKLVMCQTQGIRLAAQAEVMLGWHKFQDRKWTELPFRKRIRRLMDSIFLRRAYEQTVRENPSLERLFVQEREQAVVQMNLRGQDYAIAAEPTSNIYGALYSLLATDDPAQRKSMRYIGGCIGRMFYLIDKAERCEEDREKERYNVFLANGLSSGAARENARRQALAAANDMARAYSMLDIKLNKSLLDNIMLLGVRHAVEPLEQAEDMIKWEMP